MSRYLIIFMICLLLCGCAAEQQTETTIPVREEATQPTEPTGCYDPDSGVEARTGGAVRAYDPDMEDAYAVVSLGESIVVFSGGDATTLTMLSGENLFVETRVEIGFRISPEDGSTQVTERGISYYSAETREVVLLDTALKEIARIQAPEDIVGTPVLSANRQALYYCTADSIRVLDLEKGISRLLKEITREEQTTVGLLLNDTVLCCRMTNGGEVSMMFINTANGEILAETKNVIAVAAVDENYCALVSEGATDVLVFGNAGGEAMMLLPADIMAECRYLESLRGAVTVSTSGENEIRLDYYDLETGMRTSCLTLEADGGPAGIAAGMDDTQVYILLENGLLYRWDVTALESGDTGTYVGARYTLENQDTEGLAACEAFAQKLESQYGVKIIIGNEAVEVGYWEYVLETEYQAPLIRKELETLEQLLSVYPEGFLGATAESSADGALRICLVRSLRGSPESGSTEALDAAYYWVDEKPYVVLAVARVTERVLYHELFHIIETKVYSDSQIYYEWNKLNPEGFTYDYNYNDWKTREESEYLLDETRAFIDSYAMSFPREDRARIMEYAMTEGNESYFQSETMQEKLYQLCLGIRKAYGLEKSEESYLWEQYLDEPMAYVPKD